MENFERYAQHIVAGNDHVGDPVLPGFTVAAQNKDGSWNYSKAFGKGEVDPAAKYLTTDSTFWIASMTKIITTIAAMRCVEQGLLCLDEDIVTVLPEWKDPKYLAGFDENKEPILKATSESMTLRTLLTHMSGMKAKRYHPLRSYYENMDPLPSAWKQPYEDSLSMILVQEPNEIFDYGAAVDWAGRMIEEVNDEKLEDYFNKHIFVPLGVNDLTFHLESRNHVREKLCPLTARNAGGQYTLAPLSPTFIYDPIVENRGGGGLYGSAKDYVKVLASLLHGDLLRSETISEMFTPQLEDSDLFHRAVVEEAPSAMFITAALGSIPRETKLNFGLGGMITLEDIPGARKKSSLSWSGLPNLYWWVDRTAGVCGCFCSQVVPPGDTDIAGVFAAFEKAVYSQLFETEHS